MNEEIKNEVEEVKEEIEEVKEEIEEKEEREDTPKWATEILEILKSQQSQPQTSKETITEIEIPKPAEQTIEETPTEQTIEETPIEEQPTEQKKPQSKLKKMLNYLM